MSGHVQTLIQSEKCQWTMQCSKEELEIILQIKHLAQVESLSFDLKAHMRMFYSNMQHYNSMQMTKSMPCLLKI